MEVRCWKISILTLILSIAVSHECTQNQSRRNRTKIVAESTERTKTQRDSDGEKVFIISTEDETENKKDGANKAEETKIQKEKKREQIVERRLGRNLQPNLQQAKEILPAEMFPKVFPGLEDPHTYVDFILAIGKFPVCIPSTCQEELASMAFFADQARCAGKVITFMF